MCTVSCVYAFMYVSVEVYERMYTSFVGCISEDGIVDVGVVGLLQRWMLKERVCFLGSPP